MKEVENEPKLVFLALKDFRKSKIQKVLKTPGFFSKINSFVQFIFVLNSPNHKITLLRINMLLLYKRTFLELNKEFWQ